MTDAKNRYEVLKEESQIKIRELEKWMTEGKTNIGWGDVGNMSHVYELLAEIVDFVKG